MVALAGRSTFGKRRRPVRRPSSVMTVVSPPSGADAAARGIADGDVVLLKSSRDSGLRFLGDELAGTGSPSTVGETD